MADNQLPVYYYNAKTGDEIDGNSARTMSLADARQYFFNCDNADSFFGVILSDTHSLQFAVQESGTMHTELVDSGTRTMRMTGLSMAEADALIKEVFTADQPLITLGQRISDWEPSTF